MMDKTLLIFDIDGTLADRDTNELLPGVETWFAQHAHEYQIVLVTNQGGVGLRFWMESQGFGEPEKFPNEDQARAHIDAVNRSLPGGPFTAYMCFAYQSQKSGKWSPTPEGCEDDPEWSASYRKPEPGMIFRAIKDASTTRAKTALVGDGAEDRFCAEQAEVTFYSADDFFVDSVWSKA
jgi:HAD superfamily hydrolase (TIGR01662 family)